MDVQERLRQHIDDAVRHLRDRVPADREAAIMAVLRVRDGLPHAPGSANGQPDLISGRQLIDPGGNLALRILLEEPDENQVSTNVPDGWAGGFLEDCGRVAQATSIVRHLETGFIGIAEMGPERLDAWITTRKAPATWRERADVDWWASWLARSDAATAGNDNALLGYPADAVIGDIQLQTAVDVLDLLASRAGRVFSVDALVGEIAGDLGMSPERVRHILSALTLDRENAAWHAAVPGIAPVPIVQLRTDRVALSGYGLTSHPLLFLSRELRRRDPEAYHNAAHLREDVFRQDLYTLFGDKRFVTSPDRIRIRHGGGKIRTDIDAAIFDRKTGTLGLFELKSQDPFARSTAALMRQRDNLLYANRQVSGVLDWINRNGANDLLNRIDPRTARTFRVQKVYPFVLGRFLARFDDGAAPDRRAAWGTWPGVLRTFEKHGISATDANPIASLFARLPNDEPPLAPIEDMPAREIDLGDARIIVHPTWAAFQASGGM